MHQEKQFRQSKNAILISYLIYRGYIALVTCGILALHDWLNFRNTKLTFEKNFIVYVTGGFSTRSQEIPYEDIMSVNVDQSIIGQWFNITVYLSDGTARYTELLAKLGKHTITGYCIYFKQLSDIELPTLEQILIESYKNITAKSKDGPITQILWQTEN